MNFITTLTNRGITLLIWISVASVLILGIGYAGRLRINFSPSLPIGLYRTHAIIASSLSRGTMVMACPPLFAADLARGRKYLARGECPGNVMPLGKRIVAIPGDTVIITSRGVSVNHHHVPVSQARKHDSQHRPLPQMPNGQYIMPPNTVWLVGETADSWDSRYFGMVTTDALRGVLHPLWIYP